MPEKLNINYDEHIVDGPREHPEVSIGQVDSRSIVSESRSIVGIEPVRMLEPVKKKMASLFDEDDEVTPPVKAEKVHSSSNPFDILGLDIGGGSSPPTKPSEGGDLLGVFISVGSGQGGLEELNLPTK